MKIQSATIMYKASHLWLSKITQHCLIVICKNQQTHTPTYAIFYSVDVFIILLLLTSLGLFAFLLSSKKKNENYCFAEDKLHKHK